MKKSRPAVTCTVAALLLFACGSDGSNGGSQETTPATATTSTAAPAPTSTLPPVTTSTGVAPTATDVVDTTAPTTPADTTDDTTDSTDDSTDDTTDDSTAGTTASSDATVTSAPADASSTSTGTGTDVDEYEPVASPVVPSSTKPVSADGGHPDGVYYASVSEAGDPTAGAIRFEIVQLFTGADCIAHFGEDDEDACVNDYGIEIDPTLSEQVSLDGVFISVVDAATQQSYRISGAELHELLIGGDPSPDAPAEYLYSGFGFLVTYEGGEISRLEQWWTP